MANENIRRLVRSDGLQKVGALAKTTFFSPRWGDGLIVGVIAAFPALLIVWRRSLNITFFAVSGDDFHRMLYAWEVLQGNWVPSDLWLPLHFWIEAFAFQIYPRILWIPSLVNLAASTGTLVCLALLGRTLGLSREGTFLLLVLTASIPWFVWLSLSGLAEPLFYLGVVATFLGLAEWRVRDRVWGLWVATFALLGAGMLRFEGWGYNAIFSLIILWFWWRTPRARANRWLLVAALPWVFPIVWVLWEYASHGDPFFFSGVVQRYFLRVNGTLPLETRLLWQAKDLWAIAGITAPIGLVGLWLMRHRPGIGVLLFMWFGSFSLLMQSTVSYVIPMHNPQRSVVVHVLLLAVVAAYGLQRISELGRGGAIGVGMLVGALVVIRLLALPSYPNGLAADVMRTGQHLDDLRTISELRPGERIMVEVIFWDYILLHVLSKDPGAVVYDRKPVLVLKPGGEHTLDDVANPSLLALPSEVLRSELLNRGVKVVVTYSERAVANLSPIARETFRDGRFHVFVLGR